MNPTFWGLQGQDFLIRTLNPKPQTLNPKPQTPNPINPKPRFLNYTCNRSALRAELRAEIHTETANNGLIPAPPNYPLSYPKYPLLRAIKHPILHIQALYRAKAVEGPRLCCSASHRGLEVETRHRAEFTSGLKRLRTFYTKSID